MKIDPVTKRPIDPVTNRPVPKNLCAEPRYPIDPVENHVVIFSISAPDMTAHFLHPDCEREGPHLIADCGVFQCDS